MLRYEEERRFSVEQVELDVPAVTWNPIPDTDVAYLRLAKFSKNSASELEKAINEARDAGARSLCWISETIRGVGEASREGGRAVPVGR